ncbi:hypothetical protein SBRY_40174 [Actinacidiphila bryophytorum]|uniref:Uncharacterized protein n=1 Tax=Actinacidiphila bryophytorum TaxID=1436133 RepID=A0A9W4MGG1_9ACTN|nr:hypothetical protein SBRY_40174 [Actinacidiphila bryophytorum]
MGDGSFSGDGRHLVAGPPFGTVRGEGGGGVFDRHCTVGLADGGARGRRGAGRRRVDRRRRGRLPHRRVRCEGRLARQLRQVRDRPQRLTGTRKAPGR